MRALIIIPAAIQAQANAAAAQLFDPVAGEQTFTGGLAPTAHDAPTHYWCCAEFSPPKWELLQQVLPQFPGAVVQSYDLHAQPETPDQTLATLGLVRVQPETI